MDQLRALKYFVAVAETGSFTQASKQFSVPASSLSRRIADLEKSLGATLLQRTTRVVKLTEVGQRYFEQVQQMLLHLEMSDEEVRSYQANPMGQLRISSMVAFGESILLPLMQEFAELYPDIILDITLSDEKSALGRDDVDLAIRGGYAPNERVVAKKLMDNNFIAVASPDYLAEYGRPSHPLELRQHKGLYFRSPTGPTPWICEINQQWQDVSAPAIAICNEGKWLLEKALQGKGIIMLPRWVLKQPLAEGRLQELDLTPAVTITQNPDLGVYLLYQKQRYQVPKIKAAVDFLTAKVIGEY